MSLIQIIDLLKINMKELHHILEELSNEDLLNSQQKLIAKIKKSDIILSKKETYEPLLSLLLSLFVTEFPNFKYSKSISKIFFENNIDNIQSLYNGYQQTAQLYYSFLGDEMIKKEVYDKISFQVDPVLLAKRHKRTDEETLLNQVLIKYNSIKNLHQYDSIYLNGKQVLTASLQILQYLPKDQEQILRMNILIEEIVQKLRETLPYIKTL